MNKKPTRRDLLIFIGTLQDFIGAARGANNDRNKDRQAHVDGYLDTAHDLCVQARSFEPPLEHKGPWAIRPTLPRP